MKYDLVIVGCGLTGATIAAMNKDKSILIVEREDIGGLHSTRIIDGHVVFDNGLFPLYANDSTVVDFLSEYDELVPYTHKAMSYVDGDMLSFPLNMHTFQRLYGVNDISDMDGNFLDNDENVLSDYLTMLLGVDLYDKFYKGYSEKFWGMKAGNLPAGLVKDIPIRKSWYDNYYDEKYQYMPRNGYTQMIENMISHCEVRNADYFDIKDDIEAERVIYTGSLDEYYGYEHRKLLYRSHEYELTTKHMEDSQGVAQINYPDEEVEYTRVFEYNYIFSNINDDFCIVSSEKPGWWEEGMKRMYALPHKGIIDLWDKYRGMADHDGLLYVGRQAEYKNMNVAETVINALKFTETL